MVTLTDTQKYVDKPFPIPPSHNAAAAALQVSGPYSPVSDRDGQSLRYFSDVEAHFYCYTFIWLETGY